MQRADSRISLDDRRIQYPFAETERVSLSMLFVYSLTLPVVIITTVALASGSKDKNKWHQLHLSILGLLIALQFTSFFTDLVKVSRIICYLRISKSRKLTRGVE